MVSLEVRADEETVWLTGEQLATLFQRDRSTISRHLRNVFAEGELDKAAVVADFATTAIDGRTYPGAGRVDVNAEVNERSRALSSRQTWTR